MERRRSSRRVDGQPADSESPPPVKAESTEPSEPTGADDEPHIKPTKFADLGVENFWEVPAVAHFCSLFQGVFKLVDFDIEDLEQALVVDTEAASGGGRSSLVVDLLVGLLRGCTGRRDVSVLNYNQFLHDLLEFKWVSATLGANPLGHSRDAANFHLLPLYAKAKLIHLLCEWRLERPDVEHLTKNLTGDSLRVSPLGREDNGTTYWYFYGTRLFRELPQPLKLTIRAERPKAKAAKNSKRKRRITPKSNKSKSKKRKSAGGGSADESGVDAEMIEAVDPTERASEGSGETDEAPSESPGRHSRRRAEVQTRSGRSTPSDDGADDGGDDGRLRDVIFRIYSRNEEDDDDSPVPSVPDSAASSPPPPPPPTSAADCPTEKPLNAAVHTQDTAAQTLKTEPVDASSAASLADRAGAGAEADSVAAPSSSPAPWLQEALQPTEDAGRWSVVCRTLADWSAIAERFRSSQAKSTKLIFRVLEQEFLPFMEELFAQRERQQLRKLSEIAPKRSSDRLGVKRAQREEEEKGLRQRETHERERLARLGDERPRKPDKDERGQRLRVRELERERQQRLKQRAVEERTRRVQLRQRRQELMAAGVSMDDIPPEFYSLEQLANEDADAELNEIDIEIELEHMYGQLEKVLDTIATSPDASPFNHAVSPDLAPDYSNVIKTPMDLEMIESKLKEREYKNRLEFIEDINLMLLNCLAYNGLRSDYTKMAQRLERVFIRAWKRHFPPSEVVGESERAREDELRCITMMGALDGRIRKDIEKLTPVNDEEHMDTSIEGVVAIVKQMPPPPPPKPSYRLPTVHKQPQVARFGYGNRSATAPNVLAGSRSRQASFAASSVGIRQMTAPLSPMAPRVVYAPRPSVGIARVTCSPSTRTQPIRTRVLSGSGRSDKAQVYVLPATGGDTESRFVRFVRRDGSAPPQQHVQSALLAVRCSAGRFPPGQLVKATVDDDGRLISASATSTTFRQSPAAPVAAQPPRPSAPPPLAATSSSFVSPNRVYHIGSGNYLSVEQSKPYLMRKLGEGRFERARELDRDELIAKLRVIKEARHDGGHSSCADAVLGALVAAPPPPARRPVCSVAPQRQAAPRPTARPPPPPPPQVFTLAHPGQTIILSQPTSGAPQQIVLSQAPPISSVQVIQLPAPTHIVVNAQSVDVRPTSSTVVNPSTQATSSNDTQ